MSDTLRAAAEQALEALEAAEPLLRQAEVEFGIYSQARKGIDALRAALAAAVAEPLTDEQMRDLVKDCGLDWHRGYAPLFAGDETNRYAVLIKEVQRLCGIKEQA